MIVKAGAKTGAKNNDIQNISKLCGSGSDSRFATVKNKLWTLVVNYFEDTYMAIGW